jgi:tol-pal system protein YbgF
MLSSQTLSSRVFAQDDADPEMRIERLENQLRELTGQNEELQHRNQLLEQQLRQLQGAQPAPGARPVQSNAAPAAPPAQTYTQGGNPQAGYPQGGYPQTGYNQPPAQQPGYGQPQPGYGQSQPGYREQQIAAPPPIVQEPPVAGPSGRRGDAFDPSQNPNAPGAPRALGGGQLPIQQDVAVGAPGGRAPGEPLDLSRPGAGNYPQGNYQQGSYQQGNYQQGNPPPVAPNNPNGPGLATAPPSNSPRDEFDLGLGYMQRKDYALAEQTMKNFAQKYPSDPMLGDSQYWLGESYFQRQQYRDAAETFLAVTSKYEKSAKAPDALLRLGQSLAALKEKEAACAAFGEISRKYPRASTGVKAAVDREQKRVKC